MAQVDDLMRDAVAEHVFPGAVLRASINGQCVYEEAFGAMDDSKGSVVKPTTVFDLASLTKPLATAPAMMLLMQEGKLDLASDLSSLIPGCAWGEKGMVTVGQLLCHTSGLGDYQPYYRILMEYSPDERKMKLKELLIKEPLIDPPGSFVRYSDIGYMILAWVVEYLAGMPLSVFVEKKVFAPLGIDDLFYIRMDESRDRKRDIAPTEHCPWRKKLIRGEVHDDNAWAMGGEGGHAGLFGTAAGIDSLLWQYLKKDRAETNPTIFDPKVLGLFLKEWNHTRRTPGFDMPSHEGSSSGRYFPRNSVGHLGFTGTSFWMDPEKNLTMILLSNRVYPSRENVRIKSFRPLVHDALMEHLDVSRL
ncbi:MAG: beta-lactamase family protein [Proteobacteria bacterium]|nr:beta-lactamase family protein [Pseudomonadota bacterium]